MIDRISPEDALELWGISEEEERELIKEGRLAERIFWDNDYIRQYATWKGWGFGDCAYFYWYRQPKEKMEEQRRMQSEEYDKQQAKR